MRLRIHATYRSLWSSVRRGLRFWRLFFKSPFFTRPWMVPIETLVFAAISQIDCQKLMSRPWICRTKVSSTIVFVFLFPVFCNNNRWWRLTCLHPRPNFSYGRFRNNSGVGNFCNGARRKVLSISHPGQGDHCINARLQRKLLTSLLGSYSWLRNFYHGLCVKKKWVFALMPLFCDAMRLLISHCISNQRIQLLLQLIFIF